MTDDNDNKGCLQMAIKSNGGIVIETTEGPVEIDFLNRARIVILANKKIKIWRRELYQMKQEGKLDGKH